MPTQVAAINSSKLLIRLGDGDSPEVFSHPCMINTERGITFSSAPTESLVPYCPPDEDLPGWIEREGDALTASITGAGIFNAELTDIEQFIDWYEGQTSKNLQVVVNTLGYYTGAWVLTEYTINGPGRREKVTFNATIMSDGPITWNAGAVP
jgi:hypothetical protein